MPAINLTKLKKIPITVIPLIASIFYFAFVFFHLTSTRIEQVFILLLPYLFLWCFEVDILRFVVFILFKFKVSKKIIVIFAISSIIPYILNSVYWIIAFLNKSINSSSLLFYLTDPLTPLYAGLIYTVIILIFSFFDKKILNIWNVAGFVLYSFIIGLYIHGIAAIIFITTSLVFETIAINLLKWIKKFNFNKYLYWVIVCIMAAVIIIFLGFSAWVIVALQMNVASNMFTQEIINRAGGQVDWSKLIK